MGQESLIIRNLQKKLEADLVVIAEQIVEPYIKETLSDTIRTNVYGVPEGFSYERTNSFQNSVNSNVLNNGNIIEVSAFNSPELMNPSHTSWVDDSNQDDNIAYWLEYGNNPGGNKHPIVEYSGRHYIEDAQDEVNRNIKRLIKNKIGR